MLYINLYALGDQSNQTLSRRLTMNTFSHVAIIALRIVVQKYRSLPIALNSLVQLSELWICASSFVQFVHCYCELAIKRKTKSSFFHKSYLNFKDTNSRVVSKTYEAALMWLVCNTNAIPLTTIHQQQW